MDLSVESFRGRARTFLSGPDWSKDGEPKSVTTLEEFMTLSRQAHAGRVAAHMSIDELEFGVFGLSATLASWRGDQADKVVLTQNFEQRIKGDLNGIEGRILGSRLLLTVQKEMERVRDAVPEADQGDISLSVSRDGLGHHGVGLNPLQEVLNEDQDLTPLTPVVSQASSSQPQGIV